MEHFDHLIVTVMLNISIYLNISKKYAFLFYRKKYPRSRIASVIELKSVKIKHSADSTLSVGISLQTGRVNPVCEES